VRVPESAAPRMTAFTGERSSDIGIGERAVGRRCDRGRRDGRGPDAIVWRLPDPSWRGAPACNRTVDS
jgi:hypothetical protein